MKTYKWIKFTGDYSKLKSMGYEFQKLYANNYMQWCKQDTRIWKRGKDVTIGRFTNYEGQLLELLLPYLKENKPLPTREFNNPLFGHTFDIVIYKNRETYEVTFDDTEYRKGQDKDIDVFKKARELYPNAEDEDKKDAYFAEHLGVNPWSMDMPNDEDLAPLLELYELGWIELAISEVKS